MSTSMPMGSTMSDDPVSDAMHMGTWYCDGMPVTHEGGSWIGHVWPGFIMFMWAFHWSIGTFRNWYDSASDSIDGEPRHRSASYVPMLWFPKRLPLEPLCKAILPPIAITLELYWAHSSYRNLVCSGSEVRAGRFAGNHLGNWSHSAMYPGFIISGIVDLLGRRVPLPRGTGQVFLALGFLQEALVMALHKKHSPLDVIIHQLLVAPMLATTAFTLLEVVFPSSLLLTSGRILSVYLQGTWFWASAHMLFEGRVSFSDEGDDLAPATFVPVLLVAHAVMISVGLVALFVTYGGLHRWFTARAARKQSLAPNVHGGSTGMHGTAPAAYERQGLLHGSEEGGYDARHAPRELPMTYVKGGAY